MSKKDDFVYVGHILDTAHHALKKIKGETKEELGPLIEKLERIVKQNNKEKKSKNSSSIHH